MGFRGNGKEQNDRIGELFDFLHFAGCRQQKARKKNVWKFGGKVEVEGGGGGSAYLFRWVVSTAQKKKR